MIQCDFAGISYALLTTAVNASSAIGGILGNLLVYPFHVSGAERYLRDSHRDRVVVALQYAIIFLCNISLLLLLPLLPAGKFEVQELKRKAKESSIVGMILVVCIVAFVTLSLLYSFVLFRIFPS